MRFSSMLALATFALAVTAPPAVAGESRATLSAFQFLVDAEALPQEALADKPFWAERPVQIDGPIVWVVAALPPSVETWSDRLLVGSKMAQRVLLTASDQLVEQHYQGQPADYQAKMLESVHYRLKLSLDREGFLKLETLERPKAVWMRFGYPSERWQTAIGFTLPGAIDLPPAPKAKKIAVATRPERHHSAWDYLWEATWCLALLGITATAVGVATATSH